jgi:hypothetical protein
MTDRHEGPLYPAGFWQLGAPPDQPMTRRYARNAALIIIAAGAFYLAVRCLYGLIEWGMR